MSRSDPLLAPFLRGHVAHRALHGPGRPENSRAAIRAARALGVPVEIDVQPSRDGVAMAFHDYGLDRLTEARGAVHAATAAELGATPLRGGDEGVPTLAEALREAGDLPVLIEVKDRDGDMGPTVGALEEAVADALAGHAGPVAVMSFNPHSVAAMARLRPDLPRGLVTAAFRAEHWPTLTEGTRARLRGVPDLERVGAAFVSHEVAALDMPRVAEIAATRPVLCWTVRSEAEERGARRIATSVTFEGYLPEGLGAPPREG